MRTRLILAAIFMFILAAVLVAMFLEFSPDILTGFPQSTFPYLRIGLLTIAAIISAVGLLVIVLFFTQREERQPKEKPHSAALELIRRLSVQPNESALVETTCSTLEEVLTVKHSGWLWVSPQANDVALTPIVCPGRLEAAPMVFARGNLMLKILGQQRKPLFHATLAEENDYRFMAPAEKGWLERLATEVYVPVCVGDRLNAILAVGPKLDHQLFTRTDLEFLPMAAGVAAAMLQTAHAIAGLQAANATLTDQVQTLQKINQEMTTMGTAKNDFITIVSHELKTPVTQVLGFADLLSSMAQDNALDPRTIVDVTNNIVKACVRLGEVITQMLEMAQLDVDAVSLNYHETSLEIILKQALEPYVAALRDRHLKLTVRGLRQMPSLLADEERLAGALSQIISNAIKYTPDGGRVDIAARLLPGENDQGASAEIIIADTGIGIAPQQLSLVFEKFYRVGSAALHSTSTTKFMGGGPGLGLPVARGIIEKHGGRIWAESPGYDPVKLPGSRFFIQLPLQPPAFNQAALAAAPASAKAEAKKDVTLSPTKSPFIEP